MKNNLPLLLRPLAALLTTAALLSGCGGGGGGNDGALATPTTPPSSTFGASTDFEGVCTAEGQKRFVRSYLDEVYLWYNEVPAVDANAFTSVPDYFNALLVKTPDVNGLPKDRFSAVLPASQAQQLLSRSFAPAVPADPQSLLKNHTDSVPVVKVVTTPAGRRSGYILFADHDTGAQDDLISAFRQLQGQQIQDLVLDMRHNGGGFLYIALAAASMVAGPSAEGKVFESLRYNNKRTLESSSSFLTFSTRLQFAETQYGRDTVLPQLNLPRLYVLTSQRTCSSSESLINALRGIDVEVVLVGQSTCGKPYGFRRKDNCGFAYFPIEFQGTNAKGFGDYTAGFRPTCTVTDDATTTAGSATDPLLNAALRHIDTGNCPPASPSLGNVLSSANLPVGTSAPARPAWAGRLLRPDQ
jgi:hypothetical protein